jgi:hypothetical protein
MWQRLAVGIAVLAAVAVLPTASAHADGLPEPTCAAYTMPVAITDPGPADQTVWGQLCYRGSREPATIQLLVHGASYNHLYWDFPYGDGYYSYVDAATAAGYATFDVDRIGDGNSSHPPSTDVTLTAGAVALHDAVTALRTGTVGGPLPARDHGRALARLGRGLDRGRPLPRRRCRDHHRRPPPAQPQPRWRRSRPEPLPDDAASPLAGPRFSLGAHGPKGGNGP